MLQKCLSSVWLSTAGLQQCCYKIQQVCTTVLTVLGRVQQCCGCPVAMLSRVQEQCCTSVLAELVCLVEYSSVVVVLQQCWSSATIQLFFKDLRTAY